jgi:hypothetical protein
VARFSLGDMFQAFWQEHLNCITRHGERVAAEAAEPQAAHAVGA